MNVRYGVGLDEIFLSASFKTEVEECLSRVDSCGHSACVTVYRNPHSPYTAVFMLEMCSGYSFPGAPEFGEFVFEQDAYLGKEKALNKARADLEAFAKKIQQVLREEKSLQI